MAIVVIARGVVVVAAIAIGGAVAVGVGSAVAVGVGRIVAVGVSCGVVVGRRCGRIAVGGAVAAGYTVGGSGGAAAAIPQLVNKAPKNGMLHHFQLRFKFKIPQKSRNHPIQ